MESAAFGDGTAGRARFRRLVTVTIAATFLLILIGGIVRVSDSGLGCGPAGSGTHGWPLCEGGVLPESSAESVIEYTHRIAAGIVGLLTLLIAWRAWRTLREHPRIVGLSAAAGVLVLAQAGLGGLTVEEGLDEYLVAAHLGLAMVFLALLFALRRLTAADAPAPPSGTALLRGLSAVTALLILATIVAGGLVAGTEGEGTPNEPVRGAHTACGEQFPTCVDQFMPFGLDRLIDIQLVHRLFMYLTAIAVVALVAVAIRQRAPSRSFAAVGGLVAAQILLGAANVWFGKHAGLIVAHLSLGTIIWATIVYANTTLMRIPAPRSAPDASGARAPRPESKAATA
jgi:heme A synthase